MADTFERIAFMKKIHLFYGLEEHELEAIANEMEEASFSEGEVIFEQDSNSESFYLIFHGNVRITRKEQNSEIQLALLEHNDYFGELGLISRKKRSGTVIATSDTQLFVLTREDFDKLFKTTPQLRVNMDVAVRSRVLARSLHFKWLGKDEVIYFMARKHGIILYGKLILPMLSIVIPSALFYGWFVIIQYSIVLLAAFLSLVAWIGWIVWEIIDWGNDYYIVTNQRVIWLEKVIGIYDSRQESPMSTILGVDVETGQLGRILDFGNVIMRTFVGRIRFDNVSHPDQAAHLIEEHWNRTKDVAKGLEKDAMKNAIRRRLGLPIPPPPKKNKPASTPSQPMPKSAGAILRFLGANTLKLRYESGENVIYRKHWVVLILDAWIPFAGSLGLLLLFIIRLFQLLIDPLRSLFFYQGVYAPDSLAAVYFLSFLPFVLWLIYKVVDWSNDRFEVTNEQIIDIDRKPLGTESRNAAQLESILGTNYVRRGILGNLFNFGTVYITVGGSKLAFEDVMDPASVQSDIDRRRMARKTQKEQGAIDAERERMADWLATYHRSAQDFLREEGKNKNPKPE